MNNDENILLCAPPARVFKGMSLFRDSDDGCSRDSGISVDSCDMSSPTDFTSFMETSTTVVTTTTTSQTTYSSMRILEDMEEMALDENMDQMSTQEKRTLKKLNLRVGLGDITNKSRPAATAAKAPALHVESPKGRLSRFHKPIFQRHQTTFQRSDCRKRLLGNGGEEAKRRKNSLVEESLEIDQAVPSCSQHAASAGYPLHRVQSTSVLERGAFAHHSPEENVPYFEEVDYHLPFVPKIDNMAFRRISGLVMTNLLKEMSDREFNEKYILVDCRYPYEYNGGHIRNAVNMCDPSRVESVFYPENDEDRAAIQKRIPIFYCEYSQKRGPTMATRLRTIDRTYNQENYPHVDFKEIYVVDKGYKGFFEGFSRIQPETCSPCAYTPMDDPKHTHVLRTFSFHKKSSIAATSLRPVPDAAARQLLRRASADSPTVGRAGGARGSSQPSSRRNLFSPEPQPLPTGPLLFS